MRRLYRRICVLRATNHDDAATALEQQELASALSAARVAAGSSVEEIAVLAEEADRVSNARLLVELLAPLLAEQLHARPPANANPAGAPPASLHAPQAIAPATRHGVPGIADMIDDMLSQRRRDPAASGGC